MVAVAIAVVIGWALFSVVNHLLLASRLQVSRDAAQGAIFQLTDNLTTEEDDAWAIYVPPNDVFGKSNGDGHEVDFFARDGKQQPYFWAYTFDSSAQTLTRYRFASPNGTPTKDVTYSGITAFSAQTYPVTALKDSRTPIYSALYASAALQSGIVHFYPGMPWIAGGNNITDVHIEASGGFRRDLELVTTTAPSGFTVVLNYTPSPTPSPIASPTPAPQVWPPAIVFAAPGMTLSYSQAATSAARSLAIGVRPPGCGLDCPTPTPCMGSCFRGTPTPFPSVTPLPTAAPTSTPVGIGGIGCPPHCSSPTPVPTCPPALPQCRGATPTPLPTTTPTPVSMTPAPANGLCSAIAYNVDANGNPTTPLAPNTKDPYDSAYMTAGDGCWNSAQFVITENEYTLSFGDGPNSCPNEFFPGAWTPISAQGPTAAQVFTSAAPAGSTPLSCRVTFTDAYSQSATGSALLDEYPSPMYTQVNNRSTEWDYECINPGPGPCSNGGWYVVTSSTSYTEYTSTDQGVSWQAITCSSSSTCPYPAQFVDNQVTCIQDKAGSGPCSAATNKSSDTWLPYMPPNAP